MRLLLYSPDSYGLGHVRRSISVAKAALSSFSGASALLVTGAPRAHYFDYPEGCDYVKLPSVTKDAKGNYVCKDLGMTLEATLALRARLIEEAATSFPTNALLVDHSPRGLCGEILPTLRRLGEMGGTCRVLGMRDVIDDPVRVRAAWEREGVIEVLRNCYDRILVYGQRELFDPVREYRMPDDIAQKVRFVGYIPRNGQHATPDELRMRYAPRTGRLVVVTLGGGGDGNVLLHNFLEGYAALGENPPFEVVAVTGPLMSPRKRNRFRTRYGALDGVTLIEYTNQVPDLIEASDFAITMGGYNTVMELACAGARALIVPRAFPRREQLVRARILADRGVVRCVEEQQATPETLIAETLRGLEQPRPDKGWGLRFTGLKKMTAELRAVLGLPRDARTRSQLEEIRP